MGYFTEGDKTWWLPDTLPNKTDSWQQQQRAKRYYIPSLQTTRSHPRWYFDNGALVSDEYLNKNDGWLLLINNYPGFGDNQICVTDPCEDWTVDNTAKTCTVTYTIWTYVYPVPSSINYDQKWAYDAEEGNWVKNNSAKTITATYTVTTLSADELTAEDAETWKDVREERDNRLAASDHIVLQAVEQGKTVSDTAKTYRQALRDKPAGIGNIRTFGVRKAIGSGETYQDFTDASLWPTAPTTSQYFA